MFRETFRDLIFHSVEVVDGDEPAVSGPDAEHLHAVLVAFLPDTPAGQRRLAELKHLLRYSIRRDYIRIYRRGGATPVQIREFSEHLSDQLLPARPGTLRRQRWLTTLKPLKELGLLGAVNNLLDRLLFFYYLRSRGKREPSMTPAREDRVVFDDPLTDDEDASSHAHAAAGPPVLPDGTPDWSAWNKTQARNVERFRRSKPTSTVEIITLTTVPIARLSSWILLIHSDAWEAEQRAKFAEHGMFQTVGMEIATGAGFDEFHASMEALFWDQSAWLALAPEFRTKRNRSLSSACLSRSQCGVEMLVIADSRRCPYIWNRLLVDPTCAADIASIELCRRNAIADDFYRRYDTVAKLESAECKREVWVVSWLLPRTAMVLESRMACMRSLVHQRQQTWRKSFVDINSEWVLLQNRANEKAGRPCSETIAPSALGRKRRRHGRFEGHRTGGGGKRRAALSHFLRREWAAYRQANGVNKQCLKEARARIWQRAHQSAVVVEQVEHEHWKSVGRSGSTSHRACQRSFGPIRPRDFKPSCSNITVPALAVVDASQPEEQIVLADVRASMELAERDAAVRGALDRKRKHRQDIKDDDAKIQQWELEHTVATAICGANNIVPELTQAALWPASSRCALDIVKWPCPANELASKILAGLTDPNAEDGELYAAASADLLRAWSRRNCGIHFKSCKKLTLAAKSPKTCFVANKCFCSTQPAGETQCVWLGQSVRVWSAVAVGSF